MSLHQAIVASEYLHEMMLAAEENKVVTTMLYSLQIDFLSHGSGSLALWQGKRWRKPGSPTRVDNGAVCRQDSAHWAGTGEPLHLYFIKQTIYIDTNAHRISNTHCQCPIVTDNYICGNSR